MKVLVASVNQAFRSVEVRMVVLSQKQLGKAAQLRIDVLILTAVYGILEKGVSVGLPAAAAGGHPGPPGAPPRA